MNIMDRAKEAKAVEPNFFFCIWPGLRYDCGTYLVQYYLDFVQYCLFQDNCASRGSLSSLERVFTRAKEQRNVILEIDPVD